MRAFHAVVWSPFTRRRRRAASAPVAGSTPGSISISASSPRSRRRAASSAARERRNAALAKACRGTIALAAIASLCSTSVNAPGVVALVTAPAGCVAGSGPNTSAGEARGTNASSSTRGSAASAASSSSASREDGEERSGGAEEEGGEGGEEEATARADAAPARAPARSAIARHRECCDAETTPGRRCELFRRRRASSVH